MLREYSPDATAYAARAKPGALRSWRTHGFLDGLSERKGKGHLFTKSDVARIAVAAFIARNGASFRQAFDIVNDRGGIIDSLVAAPRNASGAGRDYVLTFVIDPDTSFPASITGAPISGINFDDEPPVAALQVNVSQLLRSALDRLESYEQSSAQRVA